MGHEFLDEDHDVGVVGIGLVQLEHRELGIVTGRDAFVAEHPGDLEHPLEATHGQALQVQLGSDPEVQLQVQGVVVGGERSGKGTARYGMEHRRLHLQEATVLQPATGRRDDPAAGHEGLPDPVGDPKVHVALPVPDVHVGDAVPLVRERPSGLGQADPGVDPHAELPPAGPDHLACHPDPVTQVQPGEALEVGRRLLHREQLDPTGGVLQVAECQFALVPTQHEATGDGDDDPGLLAVGEALIPGGDVSSRGRRLEAVRHARAISAGPVHVPSRRPVHVAHRFRSCTRRSPWSVRKGSTCWMVDDTGAITSTRPPVATTVHPPSSTLKRSTIPSTWAAKP